MRRMLTSRQIEILDSMTEEVFESGVWEIASGETSEYFDLKNLEVGYQYKIYLNVFVASDVTVSRFEIEIGLSQSYYDFIANGEYVRFVLGDAGGATNFRLNLEPSDNSFLSYLDFVGTTAEDVKFRYLITRHKLYI